MVLIAIGVGALVYLKKNATGTVLPPLLNLETGQTLWYPADPSSKARTTVTRMCPLSTSINGSDERGLSEILRSDESSLAANFPADHPELPVVNVTITDANAFAKWTQKRLPTAMEWEKAARGTEGNSWPWGPANDARLANVADNPMFVGAQVNARHVHDGKRESLRAGAHCRERAQYVGDEVTPSAGAIEHYANILKPPPALNEPWYGIKGGSFASAGAGAALGVDLSTRTIDRRGHRFPLRQRTRQSLD